MLWLDHPEFVTPVGQLTLINLLQDSGSYITLFNKREQVATLTGSAGVDIELLLRSANIFWADIEKA
jgi:hypothetical protein